MIQLRNSSTAERLTGKDPAPSGKKEQNIGLKKVLSLFSFLKRTEIIFSPNKSA